MKLFKKSAALLLIVLLFITVLPTAFATEIDEVDTPVSTEPEATEPIEQPDDTSDEALTEDPAEEPTEDEGPVFTEVDETVYATGSVNIRTGPGTSHEKVGMLSYDQSIRRIGIGSNGWSKVIYNGEEAYVFSEYLSVNKPRTDYTKLARQIAIANGLNQNDYTQESWEVLTDALNKASKAMDKGDSQDAVDAYEKALEEAIAALAKMDYSALKDSLAAAEEFISSNDVHDLWTTLVEAVNYDKALLDSGDQAAVDAAAAQIDEILAEIKARLAVQSTPEIVTQEVMVEVPPTDDYCNIPGHRVWPVLFFVSLAVNVVLVAVIVIYVSRKKKNQKDDTPLVDYDIDDDILY